jgi:hypothetical protein
MADEPIAQYRGAPKFVPVNKSSFVGEEVDNSDNRTDGEARIAGEEAVKVNELPATVQSTPELAETDKETAPVVLLRGELHNTRLPLTDSAGTTIKPNLQ